MDGTEINAYVDGAKTSAGVDGAGIIDDKWSGKAENKIEIIAREK